MNEWAERNPAADLYKLLQPVQKTRMASLPLKELPNYLRSLEKVATVAVGLQAGGQSACPEQIDTMIAAAVLASERYYPAFQLVAWANKPASEAVQIAIAEAYGRA